MSAKISAALAAAIGHERIGVGGPPGDRCAWVGVPDSEHPGFTMLKQFNLEDPTVIEPIAKRYRIVCHLHSFIGVSGKKKGWVASRKGSFITGRGNTSAQAIAALVISLWAAGQL